MMKKHFEYNNLENVTEYIGCKIKRSNINRAIKFTQPVLVQSQQDKFDLPDGIPPTTSAKPSTKLTKQPNKKPLNPENIPTIEQALANYSILKGICHWTSEMQFVNYHDNLYNQQTLTMKQCYLP